MDIFTQKRTLLWLVGVLAVMNIAVLGTLAWKEFSPKREPLVFPNKEYNDVSAILQKELDLDNHQAEQIKNLRNEFYEIEYQLAKLIRSERDSMNFEMFNVHSNDELIHHLARNVAENEYKMELLRYEQSKRLKAVCTPEQQVKFAELVKEIRDYFKPENQPVKR